VFQGLGLCVLLIGAKMALTVSNPLLLIFAICWAAWPGSFCAWTRPSSAWASGPRRCCAPATRNSPRGLSRLAHLLHRGHGHRGQLSTKAYAAMPRFCTRKASWTASPRWRWRSTFGSGVLFSFVPVLLYQGALTLFAGLFSNTSRQRSSPAHGHGRPAHPGHRPHLLDIKRVNLSNLLPPCSSPCCWPVFR
jgi:hypothetical protein